MGIDLAAVVTGALGEAAPFQLWLNKTPLAARPTPTIATAAARIMTITKLLFERHGHSVSAPGPRPVSSRSHLGPSRTSPFDAWWIWPRPRGVSIGALPREISASTSVSPAAPAVHDSTGAI
jgi:hypothetical protein